MAFLVFDMATFIHNTNFLLARVVHLLLLKRLPLILPFFMEMSFLPGRVKR